MALSIMLQGTMSGVGKSILTAGLCRILKQEGYRVAPFKSQNMALNSYITKDGLEMARSQLIQAEAAGTEPDVAMNPILLKPTSDMGSQVILHGKVLGNMPASEYFRNKKQYIPDIMAAYEHLQKHFDAIVIEGAGSPVELNLKANDIVNMGLATMVNAPVLLIGDIDRGGIFATLFGTAALLEEEERRLLKGTIINKFRGDVGILQPALAMLEDLTKVPVLGVVPHFSLDIEDEDSLAPRLEREVVPAVVDIAVVRLPHMVNFTDFHPLEQQPGVSVRFVQSAQKLGNPDLLLLPGTKDALTDLLWLRQSGLEAMVKRHASAGKPLLGIGGGGYLLGQRIEAMDGNAIDGMQLLDSSARLGGTEVRAHVVETIHPRGYFSPLSALETMGYIVQEAQHDVGCNQFLDNVWTCALHGVFENDELTRGLVDLLMKRKGVSVEQGATRSYREYKEAQYDQLADVMRQSLDIPQIIRIMEAGCVR